MLRALDRESGRVVWEYETSRDDPASFHGDPLVLEELFLIGTDGPHDDGIHALDWETGSLLWTMRVPAREFGAVGVATDIQSQDGRVYATSLADELLCVSMADGSLLWSRRSDFQRQERIINGNPAIAREAVYFGGLDGTAYAIKSEDGQGVWETHLGEPILTSVCIIESGIVMGTSDGTLHLLDAATGAIEMQLSLDKEPSRPIVEANGMLLVCTDWGLRSSELVGVDASLSRIVWTLESPEGTSWSTPRPYVHGENVLLGNTRGSVFEYRIADGQPVRTTRVEGVIRGLRLMEDVLYVGNQEGRVYAIKR